MIRYSRKWILGWVSSSRSYWNSTESRKCMISSYKKYRRSSIVYWIGIGRRRRVKGWIGHWKRGLESIPKDRWLDSNRTIIYDIDL